MKSELGNFLVENRKLFGLVLARLECLATLLEERLCAAVQLGIVRYHLLHLLFLGLFLL